MLTKKDKYLIWPIKHHIDDEETPQDIRIIQQCNFSSLGSIDFYVNTTLEECLEENGGKYIHATIAFFHIKPKLCGTTE